MPYIGVLNANLTFVIQRPGDLDPFTTSIGIGYNTPTFSVTEADALASVLATAAKPVLANTDVIASIDFDYNDGSGVLSHSKALNLAGTGGPLSGFLPQNCAVLIQKRTARAGRHGRGRMFWPGVNEAWCDAVGTIDPAALTNYTTMVNAWQAAVVSSPAFDSFVLLHSISTPDADDITSLTASPLLATQRRRLRR